mgnify:CR=1 FL=1
MSEALPQFGDDWRRRWLVLPSWNRLHRVSEIEWDEEDSPYGTGTTLCGLSGHLHIPGIFSRMGLPRCAHCCRLAGVPRGDGAPANHGIAEK